MTKVVVIALGLVLAAGAERRAQAETSFSVKAEAPAVTAGQKASFKVEIVPGAGFHMNKEYPTTLTVKEIPTGVKVETLKFSAKEAVRFVETGAEFQVPFTANEKGKKVISGELKFAVCSANSCDPKKQPFTLTIDVR